MKINKNKILSIFVVYTFVICISISTYAHSGKTDSNGGHKDNKNSSGLGSYHYHCGGNPPHLHTNGVCPYSSSASSSSNSSSSKSNSSSSTSSNSETNSTITSTVLAIEVKINETVKQIKIGESKSLSATITPSDTTDKTITWKSSDENIVTVDENGLILAKEEGTAIITASTSNNKTDSIEIVVKKDEKIYSNNIVNTSMNQTNSLNNNTSNDSEDSNLIGSIFALGLLGGGSYLGYKKYKRNRANK